MRTIKEASTSKKNIQKSIFITHLRPIHTHAEADLALKELRSLYKDATHICYGYKIRELEKCSDDKEPSGTAGLPILNTLKKYELDCIFCAIVRYFGGIKLGIPGLRDAYTSSATEALMKTEIVEIRAGVTVKITFSYKETQNIHFLLKKGKIREKHFLDTVTYTFIMEREMYTNIESTLIQKTLSLEVLEETMIEI